MYWSELSRMQRAAQPKRSNGSQESGKSDASETATVDPKLERLKADQDLAVAWLKKEWMARVEHSEGRITGLVFPGFSNVNDEVFEVVATFPELESLSFFSASAVPGEAPIPGVWGEFGQRFRKAGG